MKSTSTLGILFFIRKERASNEKQAAIYLRITVNGKRAELSIKRQVEINKWNNAGGTVKGNSEESKQLNEYMSLWRNKVYKAQKDLIDDNVLVTSEAIKNLILGKTEKHKTLVEVFEYHNKMLAEKVGIDHAQGTLDRYTTALKHVKEFIQYTYKQNDVFLANLNYKFVSDFHHYLITIRKCNQNTTAKYIKNVKRILNIALKNEWLDKDPFINFINSVKPVERDYLTSDELSTLENKQIAIQRLDNVRDIFVFSCYTGLAYIDVAELTPQNISKGIDGEMWINTHRQKTDTPSNIPLMPKALEIIKKYSNNPVAINKGKLLPVLTNQKLNAYLKEIADLCGITKNLTFHIARHTFATTVTLTNGVPIESVSSMLGHTNIKTTQIYAKVIQRKVSDDMKALREKLSYIVKESEIIDSSSVK